MSFFEDWINSLRDRFRSDNEDRRREERSLEEEVLDETDGGNALGKANLPAIFTNIQITQIRYLYLKKH